MSDLLIFSDFLGLVAMPKVSADLRITIGHPTFLLIAYVH